jgi:formate hydrogenlyase subunit 6/NADH:ubiquinone oxidoreductase subunit I
LAEGGRRRASATLSESRRRPNLIKAHIDALTAGLRMLTRKPMTLMFPDVSEKFPEGFRGYVIYFYDKCIGCSLCAQICPPRAIKMYRVPGDKRLRPGYNMGRCIFCGLCVDICPVDALAVAELFDKAFDSIESMEFDPIDWSKFTDSLLREQEERKNMLRVVIDEEVGLRYEPVTG